MDEVDDADLVVERVAALDLGKAGLEACVRVPHPQRPGRRMAGAAPATPRPPHSCWRWWAGSPLARAAGGDGIHQHLLEGGVLPAGGRGVDCWLVNAREVQERAGPAKIGPTQSGWPKSPSAGMCRPSLVQPPEIRRLRDLTRYRRALVQDRTREQQRVEKLLEDAQIKISAASGAACITGVPGRGLPKITSLVSRRCNPTFSASPL